LELPDLLSQVQESRLLDVWTALPGIVQSYDPRTNTASVQPAVKRRLEDEDGDPVHEQIPVLPSVPVVWPGGGGFELRFPLAKGDSVLLVFSQWADGAWRETGQVSEPVDVTKHGPSYAKAFAMSRAASYPSADPQLIAPSPFVVGDLAAAKLLAVAEKVDQNLNSLKTWLDAHTHPAPGGATSPPAAPSPSPAATACAKLKSE
jgi:hypothetical protein